MISGKNLSAIVAAPAFDEAYSDAAHFCQTKITFFHKESVKFLTYKQPQIHDLRNPIKSQQMTGC